MREECGRDVKGESAEEDAEEEGPFEIEKYYLNIGISMG